MKAANPEFSVDELSLCVALSKVVRHRVYNANYRKAHPQKVRSMHASWRASNRDKVNTDSKAWALAHPGKAKASTKAWKQANKETHRNSTKAWRKKYPEKVNEINRVRQCRRRANGGNFSLEEWREIKTAANFSCLCCGLREPVITLTPDHVIPISRGGVNDKSNIQPLCNGCNCKKHTKNTDYRKVGT